MPSYKHSNMRIARRGAGGRFRRSTMADLGIVTQICECQQILSFDYTGHRSSTGFTLPRAAAIIELAPRSCHRCGADVDLMGWA
jgi:hypothetical protein